MATRKRKQRREPSFEEVAPSSVKRKSYWGITVLLIIPGLFAAGFYFFKLTQRPTTDVEEKATPTDEYLVDAEEWNGLLPRQVLAKFRNATSVDERLPYLDHLERVEERAREFFTTGPGSQETITSIKKLGPIQIKGTEYRRFLAGLDNGKVRVICLKILADGSKVDFDFYSRHGSVTWDDLLTGKVEKTEEMRIRLKVAHYYQGRYSDENEWQSFHASSPDLEGPLTFYLRRSDPKCARLTKVAGRRTLRVNVALASTPEERSRKQFEISKVNALNWLTLQE